MKNILTTVATATLFTGLALSSATAASVLCFDGNTSDLTNDVNISIDLKGQGTDVNLTLVPAAVYQGASFKLKFKNGGLLESATHLLCAEGTKVGGIQEPGTVVDGVMTSPTFSFIDNDSVALLIQKDSNITFRTGAECNVTTDENLTVIGMGTAACQTISAQIVEPFSTQGQPIPSLVTAKDVSFGTTKTFIKVSCTAPECFVTGDKLRFTDTPTAAGINTALTAATVAAPVHNISTTADCPECGQTETILDCTTTIVIENNNTFGIVGLDLVANFNDGEAVNNAALKTVVDLSVDSNETEAYTLGSKFSPTVTIGTNDSAEIQLHFTPNGTDMIGTGSIVADITGLDSNATTGATANDITPTFTNKTLATIKIGANTQFTVPYMNGAVSSMAKITTRSDGETSLSADITDSKGKTCNVTLDSIPAGSSTMVFANTKAGRLAPYQNLIDAGECPDLETTEYSVVFTTNAAVDVVSYMTMSNGSQRYVDVY